ncbi:MAG: DNA polymerase III subunit alpha [Bacillota bacterium]
MGKDFAHLHVHTEYSLLDGACRIKSLVATAKELGMTSLAITDHGTMYGIIEFYKECVKQRVKPIIGCEVYCAARTRHDRDSQKDSNLYHLVLLAKNQKGYQNLLKLVSLASIEGFYYKPRVDWELLQKYNEGIIALSACLAGEIPELILANQYEEAKKVAERFLEIYGEGNFYLEMQNHGIREQLVVNADLERLSKELEIPLVATNDVHYIKRADAFHHEVLLCIQTGKNLEDENRMRFQGEEFYLKSKEEMAELFIDNPEAVENTLIIAEKCNLKLDFGELHLPDYQVPEGYDIDSYLVYLCNQGAKNRYTQITSEIEDRLNYELGIIKQMGFSGYFLIVWDMIHFAKDKGIFVGPGRGSAAGSLVAYCLAITDIDPLKYDLLFERFLNPERVSMPDIDTDFCFERRGEVIEYLSQKYGSDHVAQIVTFGTMAAKAAIRDVGRAMNVPLSEVDKLAKLVPNELGISLERALEISPEFREEASLDDRHQSLIEAAKALEGMPRHASTHAAGIVIAKKPLVEYLPLQKTTEDIIATQFPMQTVEEIGLLKMDLLGLRTLTVIGDTVNLVRESHGVDLDMGKIPLDDLGTFDLLSKGETNGVFQLESSGMKAILKNLKPERFEDIIALVALYRPGPLGSGMVDDFVDRRHGKKKVQYAHPTLKPILEDTYGVILYQEQVMLIANELAGFTLGQADLLRRAMGKKKPEVIAAQRENFIEGAKSNKVDAKIAEETFDLIAYFAGYGFNKSHSAAYALLAYQTAYLKAHYPVHYMAALLSSVVANTDKVTLYIEECKRLGIEVLPPDVNESQTNFTALEGRIRFGLAAVKNVGIGAIESIILSRKEASYQSFDNFCERVDLRTVNKRVIESLISGGAFSSLGLKRSQYLAMLDQAMTRGQRIQEDQLRGQVSLFDFEGTDSWQREDFSTPVPNLSEFPLPRLLAMEKETLGFYVTGHPINDYQWQLKARGVCPIIETEEAQDGVFIRLGGIITGLRRTITRKGSSMAYFNLEDTTGTIEVLVFPQKYLQFTNILENDRVIYLGGRLVKNEDERKVFAENIELLTLEKQPEQFLELKVTNQQRDGLIKMQSIVKAFPGDTPLTIVFPEQNKRLDLNKESWVRVCPELYQQLENIFGEDQICLLKKS